MSTLKRGFFSMMILCLTASVLFIQCSDDDNDGLQSSGRVQIEFTDAPSDDAAIESVFVTVVEVQVDGRALNVLEAKQSVDLMAYQNGSTRSLGIAELESGTYSEVRLLLDLQEDANGQSPGCYVLTDDGTKHDLSASAAVSNELVMTTDPFTVEEDQQTNLVVDFDLRKVIRRDSINSQSDYSFTTQGEVESSIRILDKDETGTIEGNCQNGLTVSDKVVVYAYAKGEYNQSTEAAGQGNSQIEFKNAVASAEVQANGMYELHFLKSGDYELAFVGYEDRDQDGTYEIAGSLDLTLLGSIQLNDISVTSNSTVTIDVVATGVIPF